MSRLLLLNQAQSVDSSILLSLFELDGRAQLPSNDSMIVSSLFSLLAWPVLNVMPGQDVSKETVTHR